MLRCGNSLARSQRLAAPCTRARRAHTCAAKTESLDLHALNTWFDASCGVREAKISVDEVTDEATRTQVLGCVATSDIQVDQVRQQSLCQLMLHDVHISPFHTALAAIDRSFNYVHMSTFTHRHSPEHLRKSPLQVVCELPQSAAVTSVDASNHPIVGGVASGRSEIAALALWLMAERIAPVSSLAPLVKALPVRTTTQPPCRPATSRTSRHCCIRLHHEALQQCCRRRVSARYGRTADTTAGPHTCPAIASALRHTRCCRLHELSTDIKAASPQPPQRGPRHSSTYRPPRLRQTPPRARVQHAHLHLCASTRVTVAASRTEQLLSSDANVASGLQRPSRSPSRCPPPPRAPEPPVSLPVSKHTLRTRLPPDTITHAAQGPSVAMFVAATVRRQRSIMAGRPWLCPWTTCIVVGHVV